MNVTKRIKNVFLILFFPNPFLDIYNCPFFQNQISNTNKKLFFHFRALSSYFRILILLVVTNRKIKYLKKKYRNKFLKYKRSINGTNFKIKKRRNIYV